MTHWRKSPKDNPIQFVCSMGSRGFYAGRGACVYCEACARLTADDSLPSVPCSDAHAPRLPSI
jgi:hypothetical protein